MYIIGLLCDRFIFITAEIVELLNAAVTHWCKDLVLSHKCIVHSYVIKTDQLKLAVASTSDIFSSKS